MNIFNLEEAKTLGLLAPDSIVNADCLKAMKFIPDKCIDFICIDPPYGLTAPSWDSIVSFDLLWTEFDRVGKKGYVAAIFGCQPFTTKVISSNIDNFKYCWYWNKNQGTNFFHAKSMPIRKVEEISIFGGKTYNPQITGGHIPTNSAKGRSNGNAYYGTNTRDCVGGKTTRFPTNVLDFKCVDNYSRVHSSQKPIDIYEYLIKTYTQEGELILDSTAGSGTLAIACINTNRRYICIEKDEHYFEVMRDRIKRHNPNAIKPKSKSKSRKETVSDEHVQLSLFGD